MRNKDRFRLNDVLWIEDEWTCLVDLAYLITEDQKIIAGYGKKPKVLRSVITTEVGTDEAVNEVNRLVAETANEPTIISLSTAQTARSYLEQYTPSAIVCDPTFPLNGKVVVGWLQEHGLPQYPLIGLSGRHFEELDKDIRQFFVTTSACYFEKGSISQRSDINRLIEKILFSRDYVELQQRKL